MLTRTHPLADGNQWRLRKSMKAKLTSILTRNGMATTMPKTKANTTAKVMPSASLTFCQPVFLYGLYISYPSSRYKMGKGLINSTPNHTQILLSSSRNRTPLASPNILSAILQGAIDLRSKLAIRIPIALAVLLATEVITITRPINCLALQGGRRRGRRSHTQAMFGSTTRLATIMASIARRTVNRTHTHTFVVNLITSRLTHRVIRTIAANQRQNHQQR